MSSSIYYESLNFPWSFPMTQQLHYWDLLQRYKYSERPWFLHLNVYSSNVQSSQTVEGALVSIERWMDKEDVVYIYTMQYYSVIRNEKHPPFALRLLELEGIMLSEVSQSEKNIIIWFYSYREYKK